MNSHGEITCFIAHGYTHLIGKYSNKLWHLNDPKL